MSKGAYDIFALVINFLDENWKSKKVTIGLFKTIETTSQALAKNLGKFLNSYNLRKKIIIDMKNEGVNLNDMTMAFKTIVNFNIFDWKKVSMEHVLGMLSLKLVNMLKLKKNYARIQSSFLSSQHSMIFKNV
jgi:hypothetical protein